MAKTITQNGVSFTSYKTSSNEGMLPLPAGIVVSGAEGVDPNYGGIINAIDIDWNDTDLSSAASSFANAADTAPVSTITTT